MFNPLKGGRLAAAPLLASYVGVLRAAAYLGCCLVLGFSALAWGAYAQAEDALRALGGRLSAELGPLLVDGAEPIELNGERLFATGSTSQLPVHEVLQRAEAHCRGAAASGAGAHAALGALPEPARELLLDPFRHALMRSESEADGMLACVIPAPGARTLTGLAQRLARLATHGDLAELGELRFVAARAAEGGRTQVVVVWSSGSFRLGALLPDGAGDAAGSDLPDVPRPPRARRELTATTPGHGFSLRMYGSSAGAAALDAFYTSALPQLGWDPLGAEPEPPAPGDRLRVYVRADRALAVHVRGGAEAERSVSLIDFGRVSRH
jgi:hypothetical protein